MHGILLLCLGWCSWLLLETVGQATKADMQDCWPLTCCLSWTLGFSVGITLVDVHLNWLNWFHFLFLEGGLLVILIDCMIFLSPFLDVTRMSVNSFFPCTARLLNSLPVECFPLTYDLNDLIRIKRHLLTSRLHLMHAIAHTLASTCVSSFDAWKKQYMPLLFMALIVWNIRMKKMKSRGKTSNWVADHFSLTFVNLWLAWVLCFHV